MALSSFNDLNLMTDGPFIDVMPMSTSLLYTGTSVFTIIAFWCNCLRDKNADWLILDLVAYFTYPVEIVTTKLFLA